ncbi:MAG: hypothetical protein F6K58_06710 [Symploca sp. SIO2E9]|nr:hypothetical protein [Symploca sp. SIO2E9]
MVWGVPSVANAANVEPNRESVAMELASDLDADSVELSAHLAQALSPTYQGYEDSGCTEEEGNPAPSPEEVCQITNVNYYKRLGGGLCKSCGS